MGQKGDNIYNNSIKKKMKSDQINTSSKHINIQYPELCDPVSCTPVTTTHIIQVFASMYILYHIGGFPFKISECFSFYWIHSLMNC